MKMTSERQRAANRANAGRSTGPKSRGGKMRASQNAYRHGLAAHTPADASWIKKVEILAAEIVDSTAGLFDFAQACSVAHAELEVQRVRATIEAIIAQSFGGGDPEDRMAALAISKKTAAALPLLEEGTEQLAGAVRRALPILRVLDRYERRAIARRDNVIKTRVETYGRCVGAEWNDAL
jgi:hypothetical protein